MLRLAPDKDCNLPPGWKSKYYLPERVWPLPESFLAKPYHISFLTTELYDPDFGLEGADKICAEAGKGIDPKRKWTALLSTTKVNAKDRVEIKGPIFNTLGYMIAADAQTFWNVADSDVAMANDPAEVTRFDVAANVPEVGMHHGGYLDQCGYPDGLLNNPGTALALTMPQIWTGTKNGGTYAEVEGSCKDWTSHAYEDHAADGRTHGASADWTDTDDGGYTCASAAYLRCLSSLRE